MAFENTVGQNGCPETCQANMTLTLDPTSTNISNGTYTYDGEQHYCANLYWNPYKIVGVTIKTKIWPSNVTLTWTNVSTDKSTCDGKQLCQIILKSIHNCRSYGLDKLWRTHAHTHWCTHIHRTVTVTTMSPSPHACSTKRDKNTLLSGFSPFTKFFSILLGSSIELGFSSFYQFQICHPQNVIKRLNHLINCYVSIHEPYRKALWQKVKLLCVSNFSFGLNVFKWSQTEDLTHSHKTKFWTRPNRKHLQMTN